MSSGIIFLRRLQQLPPYFCFITLTKLHVVFSLPFRLKQSCWNIILEWLARMLGIPSFTRPGLRVLARVALQTLMQLNLSFLYYYHCPSAFLYPSSQPSYGTYIYIYLPRAFAAVIIFQLHSTCFICLLLNIFTTSLESRRIYPKSYITAAIDSYWLPENYDSRSNDRK